MFATHMKSLPEVTTVWSCWDSVAPSVVVTTEPIQKALKELVK
jgi:hypothetical protein